MRRYLETLFRHKRLFFVPVLAVPLIALIGGIYAGKEYVVSASIWVEPSPLLDPVNLARVTPADIETKALTERLQTEAFRKEIMDRAGLTAVIQRGQWPAPSALERKLAGIPVIGGVLRKILGLRTPTTPDRALAAGLKTVKDKIKVTAEGNNLIRVSYQGKEPDLGRRLIQEAIALYNLKTVELRTQQATASIDFYTRQLTVQQARLNQASADLQKFLVSHPTPLVGQVRPPAEDAELLNLQKNLALEQALYEAGLRKLDEVRTSGDAAVTDRNRSFQVVDQPNKQDTAGYTGRKIVILVMLGVILGVLLGLIPILILTWSDGVVRTAEDVQQLLETPLVAQVPLIPQRQFQGQDFARVAVARKVLERRV